MAVAPLSLMKMSSGVTVFEISDIQEDEAEAVSFAKTPQEKCSSM